MGKLKSFSPSEIKMLSRSSSSEPRLGKQVKFLSNSIPIYDQLKSLDVDYVIFGIPEDIGSFAQNGKRGGVETWALTIRAFLKLPDNPFIDANKVAVLGYLDFSKEEEKMLTLNIEKSADRKKARDLVSKIDAEVSKLVHDIVSANKIPIVIGGGHNNAYGLIKGCSLALNQSVNVINLDAHADFGIPEGRHNGNAFSYAFNEGFLQKYFIFGLHENYISKHLAATLKKLSKRIKYNTFEDLSIRRKLKYGQEIDRATSFVSDTAFGLELDCDVMEHIPAVTLSPSGLSVNQVRRLIYRLSNEKNLRYFHISGLAPERTSKRKKKYYGKLVAYLICDLLRDH
ncbi:MAG: formimidoylglutamase [Bacteroidia bacterium]|nr:formimidoylglutamase [Bacteroidia bacterium]